MQARRGRESGATLVSLILVVLLLGLMAAIVITLVDSEQADVRQPPRGVGDGSEGAGSNTGLADRVACETSAKAIETAALAYYYGHGQVWPPDISTLTDPAAPYLRTAPDPRWGLVYDSTTGTVDASSCGGP